jgi:hypothetical protein
MSDWWFQPRKCSYNLLGSSTSDGETPFWNHRRTTYPSPMTIRLSNIIQYNTLQQFLVLLLRIPEKSLHGEKLLYDSSRASVDCWGRQFDLSNFWRNACPSVNEISPEANGGNGKILHNWAPSTSMLVYKQITNQSTEQSVTLRRQVDRFRRSKHEQAVFSTF